MANFDLIIDGYNLLHAAGFARQRYGPGDLERARMRLLRLLKNQLPTEQRRKTLVVFDGQNVDNDAEVEFRFHGLRVLFSRPQQEADDVIELLIGGHSFSKRLRVISSDHRLHKAAQARKAKAQDSEDFLTELEENHPGKKQSPGKALRQEGEKPISVETDLWMEEFGQINLAEIENSLGGEADVRWQEFEEKQKEKAIAKEREAASTRPADTTFTKSDNVNGISDQSPNDSPFDLDFWEKRIAELDEEGY